MIRRSNIRGMPYNTTAEAVRLSFKHRAVAEKEFWRVYIFGASDPAVDLRRTKGGRYMLVGLQRDVEGTYYRGFFK